jgi:methylase of polypeptide subunit release factors
VVARQSKAKTLRDVLGWSLPFERDAIEAEIVDALDAAGALEQRDDLLQSTLRISSLDDLLFLHSAFPTTQHDSVFFGPDSYRFANFVRAELPRFGPIHKLADIGTGAGVGAITAMLACEIQSLTLTDVNPSALALARANLVFNATRGASSGPSPRAGLGAFFEETSALDGVDPPLHAVIANPPYILDPAHRAYRDGGGMHGAQISLTWAQAAAEKLALGGALLLYTGSAIVNGEDRFKAALHEALAGFDISYRELDPDVFGEELEREDYAEVERIAVVGVVAVKR